MRKEGTCFITGDYFNCQTCKAIGNDGKCPYMKLDDWAEETLRVMRKITEARVEKGSRGMVR